MKLLKTIQKIAVQGTSLCLGVHHYILVWTPWQKVDLLSFESACSSICTMNNHTGKGELKLIS